MRLHPAIVLGSVVLALVVQAGLYSNWSYALVAPETLDGVFDSMLQHLLRGSVEIDDAALAGERFIRDGRVLTYFGIVPALLRIAALPFFADPDHLHVARLSCTIAGTCTVALNLGALASVHAATPARSTPILCITAAAIILSGGPILVGANAFVYAEPILWAAVWVSASNWIVLRVILAARMPTTGELCGLAALAGLAANTRATAAIELLIIAGLLSVATVWTRRRSLTRRDGPAILALGLIFVLGFGTMAAVNMARWGRPTTVADFATYESIQDGRRRVTLEKYGPAHPARIPYAASYYLLGAPLNNTDRAPLDRDGAHLFDWIEGPPNIALLTSPLLIVMAAFGLWTLRRPCWVGWSTLAGHLVSSLMLCAAMALALRYRMDFAGLLMLLAFLGYAPLSAYVARQRAPARRRSLVLLGGLCLLGIVASHRTLATSKIQTSTVPLQVRCALRHVSSYTTVRGCAG